MTQSRACHKRVQRARPQRQHQARLRRLQRERERLRQEQQQGQHALRALEQAVQELGLPETVAADVQWRLQAQQKLSHSIGFSGRQTDRIY